MSRDLAEKGGEEERRGYEKRTKEEEGKQKLRLRQTSYEMKRDVEESTSRKICEAVPRERESCIFILCIRVVFVHMTCVR